MSIPAAGESAGSRAALSAAIALAEIARAARLVDQENPPAIAEATAARFAAACAELAAELGAGELVAELVAVAGASVAVAVAVAARRR